MSCHSIETFGVTTSIVTQFYIVKFCWILYAKSSIWRINFICVFVYALATPYSYTVYNFHYNTIGINYRQLASPSRA